MNRRRSRTETDGPGGFLVVDKPAGCTSHDVVDEARRRLGTRRVGHLGTLDPLATGVLPLAVREATRLVPYVAGDEKLYRGRLKLGVETDTLDAEGRVLRRFDGALPDEAAVRAACEAFVGEIEQTPPMFSAIKHAGVPLHRLARRGEVVERKPRRVRIERLEVLAVSQGEVEIEVACSAGTYVRCLAADIGARLGCGGHLSALRRLRSGGFGIEQAVRLEGDPGPEARAALERRLVPPLEALGVPALALSPEEARRLSHGVAPEPGRAPAGRPGERLGALAPDGTLLALLERGPGGLLRILRVLRPVAAPH